MGTWLCPAHRQRSPPAPTYPSSALRAAGLRPGGVSGFGSCVTLPTPGKFVGKCCLGPQRPDVWGNYHTATWFRPGQPEQEGVAAARPTPLHITEAGLQDEACHPLHGRHSSHPAALRLAAMEARVEEGLPDDAGAWLQVDEGFGMRERTTSEAEWAVRWGRWAVSAIVPGRRKKQPYWVGAVTPNPFAGVTSSLLAPGTRQPGLAQRGQAGAVGGSFQLHLCLGKIPFHVAACDLSRQLC